MRERRNIRKKKTNIHKMTLGYRATKLFTGISTRLSYTLAEVHGMESVPRDGIVIFTPNHCNTLIDALHVLRSWNGPTVYGARADLFKNPTFAKVLRFLKILPMVRVRDGLQNVTQNYETMAEIYTVLGDGVPFCLFPEGTHRPMHSLMALKKGVFRIALEVNSLYDKPVYVVPLGLEYGDYFRYGSTCLLQVGKAFNVTEYVDSHPDQKEGEMYRTMLETLSNGIKELITYIPDDENYQAVWDYVRIKNAGRQPLSLVKRFERNKKAVSEVVDVNESEMAAVAEKLAAARAFGEKREKAGISFRSLGYKCPLLHTLLKLAITLVCLPAIAANAVMSIPAIAATSYLCTKVIKDRAFKNSVKNAVNVLNAFLASITCLIVFLCLGMPLVALAMLIIGFLAPYFTYWALEWFRVLASDIKLLFRKDIRDAFKAVRS